MEPAAKDQQVALTQNYAPCEAKSLLEDLLARLGVITFLEHRQFSDCCPPARHSRQLPPFSFFLRILSCFPAGHPGPGLCLRNVARLPGLCRRGHLLPSGGGIGPRPACRKCRSRSPLPGSSRSLE